MFKFKFEFAFTLSEVLITLGIIGVVAAMTLPSVIQSYKEKAIVNQVGKTYSMLNEAFARAIADNGTVDNWCQLDQYESNGYPTCSIKMVDIISNYLKVTKKCLGWPDAYKCMSGDINYTSTQGEKNKFSFKQISYFRAIRLANGMGITFDARNYGNNHSVWCKHYSNIQSASESCGFIYVDINGNKGPNQDGVDLFAFIIYRNGLVGHGRKGIIRDVGFEWNCLKKTMTAPDQGRGSCTAWVLQNKNLDYLHCPDKLGWDKAKSCKE